MKKYLQLKYLFLLISLILFILPNNQLHTDATRKTNLVSNIHIGQIRSNTKQEIIVTLQNIELLNIQEEIVRNILVNQINHNNLIFQTITYNSATVHLINATWVNNQFIGTATTFTINFTTNQPRLRDIITHTHLGLLRRNHIYDILRWLQFLNPNIVAMNIVLDVSAITTTSARIQYLSLMYHIDEDDYVDITFETTYPTLWTMNLNTNLGTISFNENEDDYINSIMNTFLSLNSNIFSYESHNFWRENFQVRAVYDNYVIFSRRLYEGLFIRLYNGNDYRAYRPATLEEIHQENPNLFSIMLCDEILATFNTNNNNRNNINCSNKTNVKYHPYQRQKRKINFNNSNNNYCQNLINHDGIEKIIDYLELEHDKYDENNKIFIANNSIFKYIEKWQEFDIYKKFKNLNDVKIVSLKKDSQGKIYGLSDKKELYLLNLKTFEAKKIKKELNLYYNDNKSNKIIISNNLNNKPWNYVIVKDFNLGKINPSKYKKIKFLDSQNQFKTTLELNYSPYFGKPISWYNAYDLKNLLTEKKVTISANSVDELVDGKEIKKLSLQEIDIPRWGDNHILAGQKFGLTYYFEDNNYHLQVIIEQSISNQYYKYPNSMFLANIGTGIKLYNQETKIETKEKVSKVKIYHDEL